MSTPSEPWTRPARIALLFLAAGTLASLSVLVHPWYDRTHDGSLYIHTARSILAGEGYAYLGIPFRVRPPGFAVLIAPLVGLQGGSFAALNLLVSAFGAAGVVLIFLLARPRLGWPLALLAALAVWLNPMYQRFGNQVMSDVPGTALVLACLLVERWSARAPSTRREVLLGLCIGLSAWVRSISILLVPAILAARIWQRAIAGSAGEPWKALFARRIALFAATAVLAFLPWPLRNLTVSVPTPTDQTLLYSYSTGMWHADEGDPRSRRLAPSEILERVPERVNEIVGSLGSRLRTRERDGESTALGIALIGGLLYALVKRREPGELFAAGTLAVLAVYFAFDERLCLPVYAIAFPATVEAVRDLVRRTAGARVGAILVGIALIAWIARDLHPREGWEQIRAEHEEFDEFETQVASRIAPGAHVAAGIGWHHGVYLGRPVYSLRFAVRRAGRVDAVEDVIDRYGIDTVVLYPHLAADLELVPYFLRSYGEGRPDSVTSIGPGYVVRVRP